jgi:hypothetical protein
VYGLGKEYRQQAHFNCIATKTFGAASSQEVMYGPERSMGQIPIDNGCMAMKSSGATSNGKSGCMLQSVP